MAKRKNERIDVDDLNKKIIKEKLKDTLYILSELDKELINKKYKSRKHSHGKKRHY